MSGASWHIGDWLPLTGRWLHYAGMGLAALAAVGGALLGFTPSLLLGVAAVLLVLAEGKGRVVAWWALPVSALVGVLSFGVVSISVDVTLTFYGRTSWQCGTCASGVLDRLHLLAPLMLAGAVAWVRSLAEGPFRFLARVAVLTALFSWSGLLTWVWAIRMF